MDKSRFNGLRSPAVMSIHSYSRCWIHVIWGTLNREKLLNKEPRLIYPAILESMQKSKACTCHGLQWKDEESR
jgi:REP element-mobilizing transposase RayT